MGESHGSALTVTANDSFVTSRVGTFIETLRTATSLDQLFVLLFSRNMTIDRISCMHAWLRVDATMTRPTRCQFCLTLTTRLPAYTTAAECKDAEMCLSGC
jgi:hypothetical protein